MKRLTLVLIAATLVAASAHADFHFVPLNGSDPGLQQLPTQSLNGSDPGLQQLPTQSLNGSDPGLQQLPTQSLNGSDPGLQQLPRHSFGGIGPVTNISPAPTIAYPRPYYYPQSYNPYIYPISRADFAQLVSLVNSQNFPSYQLPMIHAAALSGWFTCAQCATLMNIFSFDDNRLQVVRYIAPHLVDRRHAYKIINQLTFPSSKASARNLIATLAPHFY